MFKKNYNLIRVRREHEVTNKEIEKRTGIESIIHVLEADIQMRWRWLGHVSRINKKRHPL